MVPTDHNAVLIANALWELNPAPFANRLLDPDHVQAADMEQLCHEFDIAHDLLTRRSAIASMSGNRSASSNKKKKKQTGSSSGNGPSNSGNTAPAASVNTSVARTPAAATATTTTSIDTGAQVCLITEQAAKCIGLRISTKSCPMLKPLWPGSKAYRSRGRTNIMLSLDGSPPIWARAVVVGFDCCWEVLVGNKELTKLGVRLMTPAMQRRLGSSTQTADHPAKALDTPWRNNSPRAPQEADYDDVPDTALTHDLAFPSPVEASTAAPAVSEPVVSRPMCARLGLPADYFVPERDDEFLRQDALYPEASSASVKERLCEDGFSVYNKQ
ncbi:hypothetical protein COEREDRAFT_7004 [Coemansia reversa NRRL 1564]|uniref:Uncharacterized protein n=1 Tax=Coemansia reversa (strain ATCC 12441 / NRRL 1564) TaxID=763665 RepID=A0A2G5BGH6_COERN|nr:hypothetical protein COEREDRAFT_7004 [Coemansia reversa NRRL 1564]|eukprot:PIA17807.1 hypothetical protein COEREDRAFT_7004 [Coemansia reversa NRRL 1564]